MLLDILSNWLCCVWLWFIKTDVYVLVIDLWLSALIRDTLFLRITLSNCASSDESGGLRLAQIFFVSWLVTLQWSFSSWQPINRLVLVFEGPRSLIFITLWVLTCHAWLLGPCLLLSCCSWLLARSACINIRGLLFRCLLSLLAFLTFSRFLCCRLVLLQLHEPSETVCNLDLSINLQLLLQVVEVLEARLHLNVVDLTRIVLVHHESTEIFLNYSCSSICRLLH